MLLRTVLLKSVLGCSKGCPPSCGFCLPQLPLPPARPLPLARPCSCVTVDHASACLHVPPPPPSPTRFFLSCSYVTFDGIAKACAAAMGAPEPELVHFNPKVRRCLGQGWWCMRQRSVGGP